MLRGVDRWGWGYWKSVLQRERCVGKRHLLICIADHFEPYNKTILSDGSVTGGVSDAEARGFVKEWCADYRKALGSFRDADGVAPRHTFFYPWDEYDPGCLDELSSFCHDGFGEVEIHLHHRNDTEDGVRQKLIACRGTFAHQHGLLGRREGRGQRSEVRGRGGEGGGERVEDEHRTLNIEDPTSNWEELGAKNQCPMPNAQCPMPNAQCPMPNDQSPVYAFVHGNWCLCNGRIDGDWCGVDKELSILEETGCYADLTFPSAPSETQTRSVNEIYYGRDPRAGERGVQVGRTLNAERGTLKCGNAEGLKGECPIFSSVKAAGDRFGENEYSTSNIEHSTSNGEEYGPNDQFPVTNDQCPRTDSGVMMIPGPLGLNWGRRKFGVMPRLENGEISGVNPATVERLNLWNRIGVHVKGCPEWNVIKLHTHGAVTANMAALLGEQMVSFHKELAHYSREEELCFHYVSARELFNIIKAAEAGLKGDPGQYRNFKIRTLY